MVRAMCQVKLMDEKTTEELMDMLGLNDKLNNLPKADYMRL